MSMFGWCGVRDSLRITNFSNCNGVQTANLLRGIQLDQVTRLHVRSSNPHVATVTVRKMSVFGVAADCCCFRKEFE